MGNEIVSEEYEKLIEYVGDVLVKAKINIAATVNNNIVQAHWQIGKYIVEYEQQGNERAEYGSDLLNRLSRDLSLKYGSGFSRSNVFYIRKLYLEYQKVQTLSELSWSHYVELLKIEDKSERSFYEKESVSCHWGVRELKRQMKSMLYHRLALSSDKKGVLELSKQGQIIERPEDILKEPYVFEFTGLSNLQVYKEGDLENALVTNLSAFLLELGKGFAYIGRQQNIFVGGRSYKVDLVFYHRILKCFVLIDLKRGEVTHEDIGQMNFYLNYYREEMNTDGDTEPIGIVLGAYEDKFTMHYALQNISNQVFVSRYQLYLPNREQLESELHKIVETTVDICGDKKDDK